MKVFVASGRFWINTLINNVPLLWKELRFQNGCWLRLRAHLHLAHVFVSLKDQRLLMAKEWADPFQIYIAEYTSTHTLVQQEEGWLACLWGQCKGTDFSCFMLGWGILSLQLFCNPPMKDYEINFENSSATCWNVFILKHKNNRLLTWKKHNNVSFAWALLLSFNSTGTHSK